MAKKVFVSFDWDNDRRYKHLMSAWHTNPNFDFIFDDRSSKEINSWDIPTVKAALTKKINTADYTLVIVGKEANHFHADYAKIGSKNWLNFEIKQSKLNRNKLIGVKLNRLNTSPEELLGSNTSWAMSFTQESIIQALNNA